MLAIQMRPAYSSVRFDSSLNSASSFPIRYAPYSSINPTLSFDSNPIPLNSSHFTLSLVLSKTSQLDRQLSLYFHRRWTGMGPPGPELHTWSLLSLTLWFPPVVILNLVSKDSSKDSGCLTIHWTVFLEGFLMLFQVQPFLVVMSK